MGSLPESIPALPLAAPVTSSSPTGAARPTVRDVAARAGVGVGTVSRWLNAPDTVSATSRMAVADAVAALDYRPSHAGRALRSGVTGTVGVLVPTLSNPIFALSLEGIERTLGNRGLATIVASAGYDEARQRAALHTLADRQVDGVIATLCAPTPAQLAPLVERGLPHVLLYNETAGPGGGSMGRAARVSRGETAGGRTPPSGPVTITVDNFAAVAEATTRLIEAGHRWIAFVGGRFVASDRSRARHAGYAHAMRGAGLPAWAPVQLDFDADAPCFERAVAALLGRLRRPTALVCSNDLLGLQAVAAARALGLNIPGELSVIGFDGMPMAALASPALATVRQPAREMGAIAAARLLELMGDRAAGDRFAGGPDGAPARAGTERSRTVVLPHEFVPGGTFAPPAAIARSPRTSTGARP